MSVCMYVYVCACVYVSLDLWKAEVDSGYLPQFFFFLSQSLSLNLELILLAKLAGHPPVSSSPALGSQE